MISPMTSAETGTEITRNDIMSMEDYGASRRQRRREMAAIKRDRRQACGPDAMFFFESYQTMWLQVHEMLFIEKGGDAQIDDELRAYNPLVPDGRELVATLMFEIDDPARRATFLAGLGGVEETITIEFDGEIVNGVAETDIDRTTADGKASSVQFIHFPFTNPRVEKFKRAERVLVGIGHPKYGHMSIMSAATKAALAGDFR